MAKYYLRLEGVNLSSVLDDTPQVSVTRGASYMLREVANKLPEWVKGKWQFGIVLQPVSVGASVGIYACDTSDGESLASRISDALAKDISCRHFTFVVDAVPASSDFRVDLEQLVALNRWKQMQMPSLSLAGLETLSDGPCQWNGIRPADEVDDRRKVRRDNRPAPTSTSVATRYRAGRQLRQNFYLQEAGHDFEGYHFTDELSELAKNASKNNLDGKLAVIYIDGNRFGRLQQKRCVDEKTQKLFDETIQTQRRDYLSAFLSYIHTINDYKTEDDRLRLEILMWGGDEILMVVPAWCGIDALCFFFQQSENWKFQGESLTHAAGLVFAQHKTPLSRLATLAKELAENVKHHMSEGITHNGFDYVVLESIDYPTESLFRFRQNVFGKTLIEQRFPLGPLKRPALEELAKLFDELPKGQCCTLARALVADGRMDKAAQAVLKRLREVTGKQKIDEFEKVSDRLFADFHNDQPSEAWRWLHPVDLWDYLPLPKEEGEKRK